MRAYSMDSCRLALTRKNTETNDELQLALFSLDCWDMLSGLPQTRGNAPSKGTA